MKSENLICIKSIEISNFKTKISIKNLFYKIISTYQQNICQKDINMGQYLAIFNCLNCSNMKKLFEQFRTMGIVRLID